MGIPEPPPLDAVVAAVEALAPRCTTEHRIVLADLEAAVDGADLTTGDRMVAEELIRSYISGAALEVRRRFEKKAAQSARGAGSA